MASVEQLLSRLDGLEVKPISEKRLSFFLPVRYSDKGLKTTRGLDDTSYGGKFDFGAPTRRAAEKPIKGDVTYPAKEDEFVKSLEELLSMTGHYILPSIQSIRRLNNSSIPRWEVSFIHSTNRRGRIFIKDFNGNEALRLKAAAIPAYLAQHGIPTASPVGYVPGEGFDHRFAFLEPTMREGVVLDKIGEEDLFGVLEELGRPTAIEVSCSVIDLLANMNVVGTKNLSDLESHKYKIETPNRAAVLQERLITYLGLDSESVQASEFLAVAAKVDAIMGSRPAVFMHGDFKPKNVRIGSDLDNYYLLDWEMARCGFPLEDLAMYTLCALRDTGSLQEAGSDPLLLYGIMANFADAYLHSFLLSGGNELNSGLSKENIMQTYLVEMVFGHLYKLGDQIWTLERFGNPEERHEKGKHHFSQFNCFCNYASTAHPELAQALTQLKAAGASLLLESPKMEYLRE